MRVDTHAVDDCFCWVGELDAIQELVPHRERWAKEGAYTNGLVNHEDGHETNLRRK